MDTRTVNVLSICSGVGGIELGLRSVIPTRTVCYVENEASVGSLLAARMEDGSLDSAPIWSDLRTFDPEPWRGKVDILAGGFPCQPHSQAGLQLGEDDPRELSGEVLRIADGLGLPDLFLENVPGILRFYWDSIRPELREMGYQVAEGLFTAAETGAPHKRERLFILAHAERGTTERCGYEMEGTPPENQGAGHQRQRLRHNSGDGGNELADTEPTGLEGITRSRADGEGRTSVQFTAHDNELADTFISNDRRIFTAGELCESHEGGSRRKRNAQTGGRQPTGDDNELADTEGIISERSIRGRNTERQSKTAIRDRGSELAHAGQQHQQLQRRGLRPESQGEGNELAELPLFPPGPNDHAGWEWLLARWPELSPTYCKEGHDVQPIVPTTESKLRGASHGTPTGVDRRLRAIGNAVIPIVCGTAYRELTKQLEGREE